MAECQRCPTTIVEMANSLISHNTKRDPRSLKPIDAKGKGEVEIVQLANPVEESKWIAKKVKALLDRGVQPSEIIVLVQRKRAARIILSALKEAQVPAKSYYEESQLETEDAQIHFAMLKLLLNPNDHVALRYLIGIGSPNFRAKPYARLRDHCETSGDAPWDALQKMLAGTLKLKYAQSLVSQFEAIKKKLEKLEPLKDDVLKLIDELFPDKLPAIAELRELALAASAEAVDASSLFSAMMKEITQPDIPPEVKEVRVMSLHKSKGLSSPYVFIAQCVQGVLPQMPKQATPKAGADAAREEARRLFFVGITRVKAGGGHAGSLYLTYPKEMQASTAKQLDVPFTKVNYGMAQLSPSIFIQELGPSAPAPVAGSV
jgi:superfamily I DNA/RNA helicase